MYPPLFCCQVEMRLDGQNSIKISMNEQVEQVGYQFPKLYLLLEQPKPDA